MRPRRALPAPRLEPRQASRLRPRLDAPGLAGRCLLGDTVLAVETERGILPTPYDPEVEEALAIAGTVAGRYRNALRELAK